jgi:Tfp pilus assembly protein PilF
MRAHRAPAVQHTFWVRAFETFLVVLLVCFVAPSTGIYKNFTRTLFYGRHEALAYYLNYRDPELAISVGNYYFGGGAYDIHKATASYERALALSPSVHLAHYQLARIYFVEGNLTKATEYIDDELQIDPYNQRSLYVRGLIEDAQGELSAAEADFTRFVRWAPWEWGGYNDLSFVLAKEGKYVESEAVLSEAFKKVPDANQNPWLWNALGLAELNQLKYQEASASFQKALTLAEAITPAQWHRAYSGNDPSSNTGDINSFQQAIVANLKAAKTGATI